MYELTNETVAGRKYYARLELDDGTVLTNYGDEAVGIASISISSTLCGSESVSIGGVNAASATIVLETGAALENQRFTLSLGQEVDGAVEWAPVGIFTGTKAEFSEGRLTVEAWDDLYFAGGTYTPSDAVTGSCSLANALADVCSQAGLSFSGTAPSLTIAGMPTGLTCSAAIGYLAALCGVNACMNRGGYLVFRQFEATGQTLGTDDCYSGGMVFKTSDFTVASLTNTLEVETTGDDGAAATETVEVERTTGAAGGCVSLTNPLMTGDNIDTAWDAVKGFTYRPATLTVVGQLAVDVGDVLAVTDADGTTYSVPVMTHVLEYDGGLKSTITAAGESESQQSAAVSGPVAQQIRELTTKVVDTKVLASGKSAVYYAAAAPSAGDYVLSVNDIWFDTTGGNYAMYYWDGSAWVAAPFGTDALGDGIITAAKLVAGAVTAEKIAVSDLSALSATIGNWAIGDYRLYSQLYALTTTTETVYITDDDGNYIQDTDDDGNLLYYTDSSGSETTTEETEYPVYQTEEVDATTATGVNNYTILNALKSTGDDVAIAVGATDKDDPTTGAAKLYSNGSITGTKATIDNGAGEPDLWLTRKRDSGTVQAKMYLQSADDAKISFAVQGAGDNSLTYSIRIDKNGIFPYSTNKYNCGSSGYRWINMYTQALNVSGAATFSGSTYHYGGEVHSYNTSLYWRPSSDSTTSVNCLSLYNGTFYVGNSSYPTYIRGTTVYAGAKGIRVPEIQHGNVEITPSGANTPTGKAVTFSKTFSGTPDVITSAATTAPGTVVLSTGSASPSSTGVTVYVTRTNTTATTVRWIAAY